MHSWTRRAGSALFTLFVVTLLTYNAFARGAPRGGKSGMRFTAAGIANSSTYSEKTQSSTVENTSQPAMGYGLLFEWLRPSGISWEVGVSMVERKFGEESTETLMKTLEVPVLARYNFLKYFSVGVGAYYAMAQGEVQAGSNTMPYEDAGLESNDYGLVGAVGVKIPLGRFHVSLEGRQLYGMRDFSTLGSIVGNFNSTQLFLGFGL